MTTTLDDIRNFLITLNAKEPPPQLVDWKHDSCCSHDTLYTSVLHHYFIGIAF